MANHSITRLWALQRNRQTKKYMTDQYSDAELAFPTMAGKAQYGG